MAATGKTVRIAHLSDLHFLSTWPVMAQSLLGLAALVGGGRLLAGLFRKLPPRARLPATLALPLLAGLAAMVYSNRARRVFAFIQEAVWLASHARPRRLELVMERLDELEVDHLVVTGDLTTTSRASEFREAFELLHRWGWEGERLTVVAGNHDRLSDHRENSLEAHYRGQKLLRRVAPGVWLAALDSCRQPKQQRDIVDALLANCGGRIEDGQLTRLRRRLDGFDDGSLVVALHHPVWAARPSPAGGLGLMKRVQRDFWGPAEGSDELLEIISTLHGTVLCGHVHPQWPLRIRSTAARLFCGTASGLTPGFGMLEIKPGKRVRYRQVKV